MIDGFLLPPKPAIIIPRPSEIVRPVDPRFFVPHQDRKNHAANLINPYVFAAAGGGFLGVTTAGPGATASSNNLANFNIAIVIAAAGVSTSGTQCRVTFRSGSAGSGLIIDSAYIGHANTGGAADPYDFDGGQVQLTFDGGNSASGTVGLSTDKQSDIVNFAIDETKNLVIRFHINNSGNDDVAEAASVANWTSYRFAAADQSNLLNASSGYTSDTRIWGVKLVEV